MKRIYLFIINIILFLLFSILTNWYADKVNIVYEKKVTYQYIVYEGFYPSLSEAKRNLDIFKELGYKNVKILEKEIKGRKKYALFMGKFDKYIDAQELSNKLKSRNFGAIIYKVKIEKLVPIILDEKIKNKKIVKNDEKRDKIKKKNHNKRYLKDGIYARLRKKRKISIIFYSSLAVLSEGFSFYYYNRAKNSYDIYINESDPSLMEDKWNDVELNLQRYRGFLIIGIGAALISAYKIVFEPPLLENDFSIRANKNSIFLSMKFSF